MFASLMFLVFSQTLPNLNIIFRESKQFKRNMEFKELMSSSDLKTHQKCSPLFVKMLDHKQQDGNKDVSCFLCYLRKSRVSSYCFLAKRTSYQEHKSIFEEHREFSNNRSLIARRFS
jgi:hypothetical protein